MNTLSSLTAAQLNQAADIKEQIEALEMELAALQSGAPVAAKRGRPKKVVAAGVDGVAKPAKKRKMSEEGRARIAAGQKARWAKAKGGTTKDGEKVVAEIIAVVKPTKKRKMSAEGRAAIQAAQKARWAAKRAEKKG